MGRRSAIVIGVATAGVMALGTPTAGASIYWSNFGHANDRPDTIARANLDGTGVDQSFIPAPVDPSGIAILGLDVDAGHIYWSSDSGLGDDAIGSAKLDGSEVDNELVADMGTFNPGGLAVDSSHLYWSEPNSGEVRRADLDGSNVDSDFIQSSGTSRSMAVDSSGVYWAVPGEGNIMRADLDGSDATGVVTGVTSPRSVAVDESHIYWTNQANNIGRADLNGMGVDEDFITGMDARTDIEVDDSHIYWAGSSAIGRADLDGSNANPTFLEADNPGALAVDALTPPDTEITSARVNRDKRKATFEFSSSEPDASFRCKLDDKDYEACDSPKTYKHLAKRKHTFTVKAENAQKTEDPSPARKRFRI